MLKNMIYNREATQKMAEGILLVCKILEPTYGPCGLSVVVENSSKSIIITSSSSLILHEFKSEDLFQDEGVQLIRDAVLNMEEQVGDGSTLTALLVKGMVEEGLKYLTANISPVYMKRGLKKALKEVLHSIDRSTVPINDTDLLIEAVKASCNNYEIANMAVRAYEKVSSQGVILVKPSNNVENYVTYEEGMQLKQGYLSPLFCSKGLNQITYKNPYILITDYKINKFKQILPLLEQIMPTGKPVIIVADEVTGEALTMLIHNHSKGIFKTVVIKAEGYKSRKDDLLEDLAILTGGVVIKEGRGDELESVTLAMLGQGKEVTVTKEHTTIIGGMGADWQIKNRTKEIQEKIEDEKTNAYDKEKYRERIGRLNHGVAVMYAGGRSSQEIRENKTRMESAVKTLRNIVDGGMIPGGGSFLQQVSKVLEKVNLDNEEEGYGVKLLQAACKTPMRILCKLNGTNISNLNIEDSDDKVLGYDVERNRVADMQQIGVMDPSIVVKMALNQAVSVIYEWIDSAVLMVSTAPDKEDIELMKQGVPIMR